MNIEFTFQCSAKLNSSIVIGEKIVDVSESSAERIFLDSIMAEVAEYPDGLKFNVDSTI